MLNDTQFAAAPAFAREIREELLFAAQDLIQAALRSDGILDCSTINPLARAQRHLALTINLLEHDFPGAAARVAEAHARLAESEHERALEQDRART